MNRTIIEAENYASFSLGNELFGIKVGKVLEVLENDNVNPVPEAPKNVLGVINFRGDIVPVIDLNSRFKIPQDPSLPGVIIVLDLSVDGEKILVGVKVDKVLGVIEVNFKDIKKAPEVEVKFNPKFVEGMVKCENKIFMLINPDLLITNDSLSEIKGNF